MFSIVFQNQNFIAVDKPAGHLSVPSRLGAQDKRPCLGILLQEHLKTQIYPVHRLDLEVSGLLLFALTVDAQRVSNRWFEKHVVRKTYSAWTEGQAPASGFQTEWKNLLLRGKKRSYESPHGQEAITQARFLGAGEFQGRSLLEWRLNPITGRSHQLRVHLSSHGFPIAGDTLYGAQSMPEMEGIALRSCELDLTAVPPQERLGLPERLSF